MRQNPDTPEQRAFKQQFADNLKHYMARQGLPRQVDLSLAAGVSQAQISNILCLRMGPTLEVVRKLGVGLGIEPGLLLMPPEYAERNQLPPLDQMVSEPGVPAEGRPAASDP